MSRSHPLVTPALFIPTTSNDLFSCPVQLWFKADVQLAGMPCDQDARSLDGLGSTTAPSTQRRKSWAEKATGSGPSQSACTLIAAVGVGGNRL